jgi:hypothetical protein
MKNKKVEKTIKAGKITLIILMKFEIQTESKKRTPLQEREGILI